MPTGKQVSFAYGEVSPSLRFTTDATFYSAALARLKNGIVRKSGGVSNRPGMLHFSTTDYQSKIPSVESPEVGVRIFPFTSSKASRYLIEVQAVVKGAPPGWNWVTDPVYNAVGSIRYLDSGGNAYNMTGSAFAFTQFDDPEIVLDLSAAVITTLNDSAIITFNTGLILVVSYNEPSFSVSSNYPIPTRIGTPTALLGLSSYGLPPSDIPVCYLVTQELDDGSEVFWQQQCFVGGHPHSDLSSSITINTEDSVGVKQYNVYRSAAGPGGYNGSSFGLVGRLAPNAVVTTFTDYLVVPDNTVQPPIQFDLYPPKNYIRRVVYYKERALIIVKKAGTRFIEGMVIASKLGAPKMLGRPLTPNVLDAFSFTIPQDKLSTITNVLVLNKLILFTSEAAVHIRGGEGGVLTSQTVNPEVIYHEGSTPDVAPVAVGSRGFYVTPDLNKLIMILFERDDSVRAVDASTLSDHLFEDQDIRSMVLVKGPESILWVLKKDGTLVSVTVGSEGNVLGYAKHDTDGYVEDICVLDAPTDPISADIPATTTSTLYLSVIRNGVRLYERLSVRGDSIPHTLAFVDSAVSFGRYRKYPKIYGFSWNITTSTTYQAGEILNLENVEGYGFILPFYLDIHIEFYYYEPVLDENGRFLRNDRRSVRLIPLAIVDTNNMTVYCEQDLPVQLQDIGSKGYSYEVTSGYQGWFSDMTKTVYGLQHLAGREVSVYADGKVISSANKNDGNEVLVVSPAGELELPEQYAYGYVGLPYTFEMETLDLEASDARTFTDKGKLINNSGVALYKTLGGEIGANENSEVAVFEPLTERETYGNIDVTTLSSGIRNVPFPGSWNAKGSVVIRQVDPLPITVLAVYPKGVIGD